MIFKVAIRLSRKLVLSRKALSGPHNTLTPKLNEMIGGNGFISFNQFKALTKTVVIAILWGCTVTYPSFMWILKRLNRTEYLTFLKDFLEFFKDFFLKKSKRFILKEQLWLISRAS